MIAVVVGPMPGWPRKAPKGAAASEPADPVHPAQSRNQGTGPRRPMDRWSCHFPAVRPRRSPPNLMPSEITAAEALDEEHLQAPDSTTTGVRSLAIELG